MSKNYNHEIGYESLLSEHSLCRLRDCGYLLTISPNGKQFIITFDVGDRILHQTFARGLFYSEFNS